MFLYDTYVFASGAVKSFGGALEEITTSPLCIASVVQWLFSFSPPPLKTPDAVPVFQISDAGVKEEALLEIWPWLLKLLWRPAVGYVALALGPSAGLLALTFNSGS